ncbi:MAG: hypothetical protein M3066_00920 [Actinomycetota bacterium]|nr:hypothetical protein [Actinomycetota bacterium]
MEVAEVAFRNMVLGAVLLLWAGACGSSGGNAEVGSSGATSSTEPTTTELPSTTAVASTTTPPTAAPPTTARAVPVPGGVTTTLKPVSSPFATSTTRAGGVVRCSPAVLAVEVSTDKAAYRPGERVQAQAVLRNRSGAPCLYNSYVGSQHFEGPGGQPVSLTATFVADAFADTPLAAGAAFTQSPTWDQQACATAGSCAAAPPGTYTVKVSWSFDGAPAEGSATFRLVGN